jgi:protoporphyrinogen/coproporphyrinogen III oxidase
VVSGAAPGPDPGDVIVVGAGPSGLAAAHRLARAGVSVRLLDAADQVGGKMSTTYRGGFIVDNGAFFITSTYRNVLSIADEVGMGNDIVAGRFVLSVVRDGVLHDLDGDHLVSAILKTKLLSPRAKAELVKLGPELVRSRKALYDRIPGAGRYDTESVRDWAESHLSPELQEFLIGALMRGISATNGADTSRVDFLALLTLLGGAKLLAFKDGMNSYAERIAQDKKGDLGANVNNIEDIGGGVTVRWTDASGTPRVERAAACIVATPGRVTAEMVPQLDDWRKGFLRRVNNNRLLVVNVGLSQRPPLDTTYILVPESTHPFVTGLMFDHYKAPGRAPESKGLMSVALLDTWCRDHWDDDDDDIRRAVLEGVGTILPRIVPTVEFAEVRRWYLEVNPIGFYRDLGKFRKLCEEDTRIQLAGDSQSMQNIEAATTTGLRAADRLLATGILRH